MSDQVVLAKDRIRSRMRRRRAALDPDEVDSSSAIVVSGIGSLMPSLLGTGLIASYRAVRGEVCLDGLTGSEHRDRLTFPRVNGRDLEFVAVFEGRAGVRGRSRSFAIGAFSVPEPVDGRIAALADHDVVLVPLTAFDERCQRVGQGGGFYDRALALSARGGGGVRRRPVAIGVAYAFQQVDEVPLDPWDVPLDAVVTDSGLFTASSFPACGIAPSADSQARQIGQRCIASSEQGDAVVSDPDEPEGDRMVDENSDGKQT